MTALCYDIEAGFARWIGVGNVEAICIRREGRGRTSSKRLVPSGGIVGYRLPELHRSEFQFGRTDTLILVTDGVRDDFETGLLVGANPKNVAQQIVSQYGAETDDAAALVCRPERGDDGG